MLGEEGGSRVPEEDDERYEDADNHDSVLHTHTQRVIVMEGDSLTTPSLLLHLVNLFLRRRNKVVSRRNAVRQGFSSRTDEMLSIRVAARSCGVGGRFAEGEETVGCRGSGFR